MNSIAKQLNAFVLAPLLFFGAFAGASAAGSTVTGPRRVEVYDYSQPFYDTRYGDTLSEILWRLLPNSPGKHAALQEEILQLNPQAFINGDPDRLLANRRLYLPGHRQRPHRRVDSSKYTIETYSWGNIKRPR